METHPQQPHSWLREGTAFGGGHHQFAGGGAVGPPGHGRPRTVVQRGLSLLGGEELRSVHHHALRDVSPRTDALPVQLRPVRSAHFVLHRSPTAFPRPTPTALPRPIPLASPPQSPVPRIDSIPAFGFGCNFSKLCNSGRRGAVQAGGVRGPLGKEGGLELVLAVADVGRDGLLVAVVAVQQVAGESLGVAFGFGGEVVFVELVGVQLHEGVESGPESVAGCPFALLLPLLLPSLLFDLVQDSPDPFIGFVSDHSPTGVAAGDLPHGLDFPLLAPAGVFLGLLLDIPPSRPQSLFLALAAAAVKFGLDLQQRLPAFLLIAGAAVAGEHGCEHFFEGSEGAVGVRAVEGEAGRVEAGRGWSVGEVRLQFAAQEGSYLGAVQVDEVLEEFVHEGAAEALLAAPPAPHRTVAHPRRPQDLRSHTLRPPLLGLGVFCGSHGIEFIRKQHHGMGKEWMNQRVLMLMPRVMIILL